MKGKAMAKGKYNDGGHSHSHLHCDGDDDDDDDEALFFSHSFFATG
jgi:hypothetical protein